MLPASCRRKEMDADAGPAAKNASGASARPLLLKWPKLPSRNTFAESLLVTSGAAFRLGQTFRHKAPGKQR